MNRVRLVQTPDALALLARALEVEIAGGVLSFSGCWLAAFMVSGIVMSEIISPMTSGSTAFIIKRNQVKIVILFML